MRKDVDKQQLLRSLIVDTNARYLGIDTSSLLEEAGEGIAKELVGRYGKGASYAFLCGLGQNGGEGMAAARYLLKLGVKGQVTVYLFGRVVSIISSTVKAQWSTLAELKECNEYPNLFIKQDAFAKDIALHNVIVECLIGRHANDKLYKRFRDAITRVTHFKQRLVAIETPVPGYAWDLSLSLLYPKTEDATVVSIGIPREVELYTGPGEVQVLEGPDSGPYKTRAGRLLILTSPTFTGPELEEAIVAASTYVGTIFINRPSYHLQGKDFHPECKLEHVDDADLERVIDSVGSILVGFGWADTIANRALLDYMLRHFPEKKFVLTPEASRLVDRELAASSGNVVFVTGREYLQELLGDGGRGEKAALEGRLRRFAAERNCYVNCLGSFTLLFGKNPFSDEVETRMVKAGAQIIGGETSVGLHAGITAALASRNHPWLSMSGGAFLAALSGYIPRLVGEAFEFARHA